MSKGGYNLYSFSVTICLEEEVAESLVEYLVEADLPSFLQILDHHRPHAGIWQQNFFAGSVTKVPL